MRSTFGVIGTVALGLLMPVMATVSSSQVANAAPTDPVVVYDSIGSTIAGNVPSQAYEATSTREFGDLVRLAPGPRQLNNVTIEMSSWACENGSGASCVTTPGATFAHPLTVNIYAVAGTPANPTPGSLLATLTKTVDVPFRPSAAGTGACATGWVDPALAGSCYNGFAFPASFDFPTGTVLPSQVIWTLAFNTNDYGAAPLHLTCASTPNNCGFNSLNVGLNTNAVPVIAGTDLDADSAFLSSTWAGAYCDSGVTGTLRSDVGAADPTDCWTGYVPMAKIVTTPVAATESTVVVDGLHSHGWRFIDDNNDPNPLLPPTFVTGPAPTPLGTGSVQLQTLDTNDRHNISTTGYIGTPVANLTTLAYSIFQPTAGSNFTMALQFDVKYRTADVAYGGRLVFEPINNGGVVAGWQRFSTLTGKWWASKTTAAGSNGLCGQGSPCTWAQVLANWPQATINGALLVRAGGGGWPAGFTGNVDDVTVGADNGAGTITTTSYDFENNVPTPPVAVTTSVFGNTVGGENNTAAEWSYDHFEPKVPGTESIVTDAAPVAAGGATASLLNGNLKLNTIGNASSPLAQQARAVHTFSPATAPTLTDLLATRPSYSVFVPSAAELNGQGNLQFGFQCGAWTGAVILSPPDNGALDINGIPTAANTWQTFRYPDPADATKKVFVSTDAGTAPAGFAGYTEVSITALVDQCPNATVINARLNAGRNTVASATSYLDNATFLGHTYDFVTAIAPNITSGAPVAGVVGTPYSFTFTASGAPTPTVTVSGPLPAGLTVANGVLSGTPTAAGSFSLLVNATNGVAPDDNDLVTVVISAVPTAAPTISGTPTSGTVATPYSFTFTKTGTPTPTVTSSGTLPTGLTLSSAGVLSGTPLTSGTFTFLVTASNGVQPNANALVSVTIDAVVSLAPTGTAATPVAVTPVRLMDTRKTTIPASGSTTSLTVTGLAGVPVDAQAVFLNVTATDATGAGYVTVWANGTPQPGTSSLNVETVNQTIPNLVVTPVGADGKVSLFVQTSTQLVVDVLGYIPAGTGYSAITPTRALDTRKGARPGDGAVTTVKVTDVPGAPAGATSVIMNVTDVNTSAPGYVTVWPGGQPQPATSNLNVDHVGQTRPGLVIVPIGADGKISIYQQSSADILVDVVGFFTAEAKYNAIQPSQRMLDTRTPTIGYSGGKPVAKATVTVKVAGIGAVPANVKYVVVNVTADQPTAAGYITVFPGLQSPPLSSNLNVDGPANTASNLAFVPVGADGSIQLYTQSGTHLVLDVFGWVS